MINEKELRTGNLYSTIRNQEIVVMGIDTLNKFVAINSSGSTDTISKNESTVIFEDLSPIEITPKLIGQLRLAVDQPLNLAILADNETKFVWSDKLNQVVLMDNQNGIIGPEIKYIHQLQNLFYHLTGKELSIQ